eukprot:5884945-Pyramimonas_sp.AAC.3
MQKHIQHIDTQPCFDISVLVQSPTELERSELSQFVDRVGSDTCSEKRSVADKNSHNRPVPTRELQIIVCCAISQLASS